MTMWVVAGPVLVLVGVICLIGAIEAATWTRTAWFALGLCCCVLAAAAVTMLWRGF